MSGVLLENLNLDELETRLRSFQNNQPASNWFDRFKKGAKADEVQDDSSEVRDK